MPPQRGPPMTRVPVFLHHHVANDRPVTVAGFDAQLRWLSRRGFATPTLDRLLDHVSGARPLPRHSLLLTFDDGYADNWFCVYPLLRQHGLRATVFLTTGCVTRGGIRAALAEHGASPETIRSERRPEGFLSWDEVRAMAVDGVIEFGSHSHTHNGFDRRRPWPDLAEELVRSKAVIEDETGKPVVALAWPWGRCDERLTEAARRAGYRLAFTTELGANRPHEDPMRIRRIKVRRGGAMWLASRIAIYTTPGLCGAYVGLTRLELSVRRALGLRGPR